MKSAFLKSIDPRERFGIYAKGFSTTGGHELLMAEKTRAGSTKSCHKLKQHKDVVFTIYDKFDSDLNGLIDEDFNSLSTATYIKYVLGLWKGLAFYHKHKFVHCDIKEANIAYVKRSGFFFTDFDWSLHLTSCKVVDDHIDELRRAVEGNPYEYWTPLLTTDREPCDDKLLYYNDVYGLSVVCQRLFKKLAMVSEKCENAFYLFKEIVKSNDTSISAYRVYRKLASIL